MKFKRFVGRVPQVYRGVPGAENVGIVEPVNPVNPAPPVLPPIVASPTPKNLMGVNISMMESSGNSSLFGQRPDATNIQHFTTRNIKLFRFCTAWQLWQPTLGGGIDPTYLSQFTTIASTISAAGGSFILDVHSYAQYNGGNYIGTTGGPTIDQFADFWSKLCTAVTGMAGLEFYGLMNEPKYLSNDIQIYELRRHPVLRIQASAIPDVPPRGAARPE